MELRKVENKDISAVAELVVETMTPDFKRVGEPFFNKKQYADNLKEALESMEFGVVAEDNKKIVGFAHWYYEDNQAFIEDLVISPAMRKKGFGKALASFVMQACKKDNIESVTILLPFDSTGIDFAKKLGFQPITVELKQKL
jgi:N-acetylglutamate synthase-like GNAT family acetyltransferase